MATVLGSGMAFLDATVVNIALPSIGEDFDASLAQLQWTVNAYALTLAGLILIGGSLGDHLGRRRVFVWGVCWFAIASLLCALAPTVEALILARAVQGVGAALLTPGSLAILEAVFHPEDRGAAIGAWSGLAGVSTAIGPFLGGWLVEAVSWRLIFVINLPLAAVVVWAARRIPETYNPEVRGQRLDWAGAALTALGLAGVTYALTEGDSSGWTDPTVVTLGILGVAALGAFLAVEARGSHPMVPLDIFRNRLFSAANAMTFIVYAALAGALFLLPIQLQQVAGYSPLEAGSALIPFTIVMLLLSSRAGRLAQRIGPRLPMGLGPIIPAVGLALLTRVGPDASYVADVLPAVLVFGLGLAVTVAPLNVTVLGAAGEERAGIASAINNAVARVASLLAVAVIPLAAGISGDDYLVPEAFDEGFQTGILICAAACAAGGVLALATIRRPEEAPRAPAPVHCCISGPPPEMPLEAPPATG
ncbi:MAG TPA: MFS transporter [Miltoncostaeaceae bacterium]|nr:MFS transporter [Miltoncostaeaceae bacterium]